MQQQNLISPSLTCNSVSELTNGRIEELVDPPNPPPAIPPFPPYTLLRDRKPHSPEDTNVLLVIPTANTQKTATLCRALSNPPHGGTLHHITVPAQSGVGEQPYDDAGVLGAYNRINNALRSLTSSSEEYLATILTEKRIGTVMVASIENYIQRPAQAAVAAAADAGGENKNTTYREGQRGPAVDYGLVVVHNATTGQTASVVTAGVPVPQAYLDHAQSFGFEEGGPGPGNHDTYGKVTVGEVLEANVPGLDKANWHAVVAGRSRYDLLEAAIQDGLRIPW